MKLSAFVFALGFGCAGFILDSQAQSTFAHFEGRQTHPVGLTPDRTRLLALNTPDARLSVFDVSNPANPEPVLFAEIPVGLEPVSLRARTDDEVWVINEVSDSVSIVSLSRRAVIETLDCPDEPADVAFAQGRAFISCARNNLIRVFDADTRAVLPIINLQGLNPRALAADPSGLRLFVAFHLSGNGTTVLPVGFAPPQPDPTNTNLPPPPPAALIVPAGDPGIGYTVLDRDVAEISVNTRRVQRYYPGVGTILFDLALRPGANELWVANTEALNLVRFEPNLRGHFVDNRVTRLTLGTTVVTPFDLNPGTDYGQLPNPAVQARALAQPAAIVFSADGSNAWVAAFASDRVAKLDAADATVLALVDVRTPPLDGSPNDSRRMRGPRGLALHEGHQRLYVLNKLANSISVIDTATAALLAEVPAGSHAPTPLAVKEGRGFLFDARLSGNGSASCGTCHVDADRDGLAWDLGDPAGEMNTVIGANLAIHDSSPRVRVMHPMKGPMVTQTLRGLSPNQLLHWRGDRATLLHFNPTFRDLMGGDLIPEADMDTLKAYLDTLRHHPNPNRNLDNTLPATFEGGDPTRGRGLFAVHNNHCGVCHVLPTGSDNNVDDPRNIGSKQPIKTPSLQTVHQRALLDTRAGAANVTGFGLGHDGSGGRQFLPTVHFYELDELSGQDFADVTAFLLCFDTGTAPAVGFNRTVTSLTATNSHLMAEIAAAQAQALLANACNLVVRGRVRGEWRQFYFDRAWQLYQADRAEDPLRSRDELLAMLGPDDALTFLGVLPGEGLRLGIDRDGNGVLDGDESKPSLSLTALPASLQLSWPESARDWLPERAAAIDGPWRPDLLPRSRGGGLQHLHHPRSEEPMEFFRLRRVW
jgi:YVTN family beta-propeller protein